MQLNIELERNEIQKIIQYALICEIMAGSKWNTGSSKRKMEETFTEKEQAECQKLYRQAHQWHLVKGVPDKISMKPETLALWQKLALFCSEL